LRVRVPLPLRWPRLLPLAWPCAAGRKRTRAPESTKLTSCLPADDAAETVDIADVETLIDLEADSN
jgi:hypothetical protein